MNAEIQLTIIKKKAEDDLVFLEKLLLLHSGYVGGCFCLMDMLLG